uniref:SJCHGC08701 protein n=1 Tax=Schistosoma japonicum TaxID=6182 RepID=Q5DBQ7_SCHJA|nr:SJCHGC08701 protein [Schistosoma japonicum]
MKTGLCVKSDFNILRVICRVLSVCKISPLNITFDRNHQSSTLDKYKLLSTKELVNDRSSRSKRQPKSVIKALSYILNTLHHKISKTPLDHIIYECRFIQQ